MKIRAPFALVALLCGATFTALVAVDPGALWPSLVSLYLGAVMALASWHLWTWDPPEVEEDQR